MRPTSHEKTPLPDTRGMIWYLTASRIVLFALIFLFLNSAINTGSVTGGRANGADTMSHNSSSSNIKTILVFQGDQLPAPASLSSTLNPATDMAAHCYQKLIRSEQKKSTSNTPITSMKMRLPTCVNLPNRHSILGTFKTDIFHCLGQYTCCPKTANRSDLCPSKICPLFAPKFSPLCCP
jgi:hypothetical protein